MSLRAPGRRGQAPTTRGRGTPGWPWGPRGRPEVAPSGRAAPPSQGAGWRSRPPGGRPEAAAPQAGPRPPRLPSPDPRSLGGKEKEMKTRKADGASAALSRAPPAGGPWGQQRGQPRPRPSLGRGRGAGLLLPRHGDGSLAVAGVHARWDLGAREGQHAVRGQGAGERRLVHVGRQAVAAVELPGDVAVVILGGGGRGQRHQGGGAAALTRRRPSWASQGPAHHARARGRGRASVPRGGPC